MPRIPIALVALLLAAPAARAELADHLVITEVGYDVTAESVATATAEYLEIFNPTNAPIALNEGAIPGEANGRPSYFLSDMQTSYWKVVAGKVPTASSDFTVQFPVGVVIPPKGVVVVCNDATTFLKEFFPGASTNGELALFQALPGAPQLFEVRPVLNDVPDMIWQTTATGTAVALGLTNGSEPAILFRWDGTSDLVEDVDVVVWGSTASNVPNKTGVIQDGPDSGTETSAYKAETPATSLAPSVSSGTDSLQRRSIDEPGELTTGGNGLGGRSPVTETWGTYNSAPNPTWANDKHTPGHFPLRNDGKLSDALSFLFPLAASDADGPASTDGTRDYGDSGTVTELYATAADSDLNNTVDAFYLAVRGELFGEPDTNGANTTLVLVDLDPGAGTGGAGTGVRKLLSSGGDLTDTSGNLDTQLTRAQLQLPAATADVTANWASVGFDAALVLDTPASNEGDKAAWRAFGTGPATGTGPGDLAWLTGTLVEPKFDATTPAAYPKAPGTTFAATEGFEALIPWATILKGGAATPRYVFLVAATTQGNGGGASANTLPESTGNDHATNPQVLDKGVCLDLLTGRPVTWYVDADGDGVGSATLAAYCGPARSGLAAMPGDCNDVDPAVKPGATETCNGKDDDCDATVDEEVKSTFYADADGDGYGNPASTQAACVAPANHVTDKTDCDDAKPAVNPGKAEICDGLDNDCNATVDEGVKTTYYADADGDGFGNAAVSLAACTAPANHVTDKTDCDDAKDAVNPGKTEICDGLDNDCDATVDEGVKTTFYADADGDGFGNPTALREACTAPANHVTDKTDCDDTKAGVKPTGTETCDGLDNDCDATIDEDVKLTFYKDADGDAFGAAAEPQLACTAPTGFVADKTDCDDAKNAVNPGKTEICDGLDNDCDAAIDEDVKSTFHADTDGDGFGAAATRMEACVAPPNFVVDATDCDDTKANVKPGLAETCDGLDNDCAGGIDNGVGDLWYADADGDEYGAGAAKQACARPDGHVANDRDCDDLVNTTNPGAAEICNGVDDDCGNGIDDGVQTRFFQDLDGDGFGLADTSVFACAPPELHAEVAGDCNDSAAAIHPDATETCNDVDDDCDDVVDEDLKTAFFADADKDGHGAGAPVLACTAPEGHVTFDDDCDDADPDRFPGHAEACDGKDNACAGTLPAAEADADADGLSACAGDCDDANAAVKPDDRELACDDDLDNDCDSNTDEADTDCKVTTPAPDDSRGGCGCQGAGDPASLVSLVGFAGLLALRRRRQA